MHRKKNIRNEVIRTILMAAVVFGVSSIVGVRVQAEESQATESQVKENKLEDNQSIESQTIESQNKENQNKESKTEENTQGSQPSQNTKESKVEYNASSNSSNNDDEEDPGPVGPGTAALPEMAHVYEGIDYYPVYDFYYYTSQYPDIKRVFGNDPEGALKHYVTFGIKEGRQADYMFNIKSYRNANPDLRSEFEYDNKKYVLHFIRNGKYEGRITNGVDTIRNPITKLRGKDYKQVYDFEYYKNNNPDIYRAYGNDDIALLKHFIEFGMREERQAKVDFDEKSYRYANADLRWAFKADKTKYYNHFIKHGYKEGRVTTGVTELKNVITKVDGIDYSSVYNFEYYIQSHPDLKNAFGTEDDASALDHFLKYGMRERRKGNENFDVNSYRYQYRDLRIAFKNNFPSYYRHYIQHGRYENRNTKGVTSLQNPVTIYGGIELAPIYDYYYYASHYPDLINAYGDDDVSLLEHFGGIGIMEGRVAKDQYDQALYADVKERLHPTPPPPPPVVATDSMFFVAQKYSSPSQYLILVDRSRHQVGIFSGSKGRWGEVDYFLCGDGKASTPTVEGLFHIINKKPYFDSGSARCWYATRIYKGYLFHSVLYTQTSTPSRIKDGRLGVGVSHGCVRLDINKAKWIYDNIPIGTTVVIYS